MIKVQEKQKQHSQVFLNLIYFYWRKLIANNNTFVDYFCITSFHYILSAGREFYFQGVSQYIEA